MQTIIIECGIHYSMERESIGPGGAERDRFDRARRIGWLDMDTIEKTRVLMVGAGAIGNEVGKNLVLSGFRDITVVDMDRVVNSNLARCLFFSGIHVIDRRLKAEIVASGMAALDPAAAVNRNKVNSTMDYFLRFLSPRGANS